MDALPSAFLVSSTPSSSAIGSIVMLPVPMMTIIAKSATMLFGRTVDYTETQYISNSSVVRRVDTDQPKLTIATPVTR